MAGGVSKRCGLRASTFAALTLIVVAGIHVAVRPPVRISVEKNDFVYSYREANNGAGPMWCSGSTCLVRANGRAFVSTLELIDGAQPLSNCRWTLRMEGPQGWQTLRVDNEHTREPSPLATLADGRVYVSTNPAIAAPDGGGTPQIIPQLWQFSATNSASPPVVLAPKWDGTPPFTDHSYRSFAADGEKGELLLFHNIGYTHAEWAFLDRAGNWAARGRLTWPWGKEYEKPEPIRICYSTVALRDRAVHFFGVSDIIEPRPEWRAFKRKLTGQEWDYDFRRLFYTSTADITKTPFSEWIEVASRESTAGHLFPCDLRLAPDGSAHVLWTETALDERLRPTFFPGEKQSHALWYAIIAKGKVVLRRRLLVNEENSATLMVTAARFYESVDHRLFVVCHAMTGKGQSPKIDENQLFEIKAGAVASVPVRLPLEKPFISFFTATPRAGSPLSPYLEMFGQQRGDPNAIHYARLRLD